MVVLVTGGSGFIGGHVVDELCRKHHEVRVFDSKRPFRKDVEWFAGDLLNEKDALEACENVDAIYHLAAIADVNVASLDPALCLRVNELGTLNLLKAATSLDVERVILSSTTWVYGKTIGVVTEDTSIPFPDNMYAKTKIGQEHLLASWWSSHGLPYTILRCGSPYGSRMRSNLVLASFVKRAMEKKQITVFGDGSHGRCFIHVSDVAKACVLSMSPNSKNMVFNVDGSRFITVNEIVKYLKYRFADLRVEYQPSRPNDLQGVVASTTRIHEFLGWKSEVDFEDGMNRYVDECLKLSR